jgi:hypothetical protein
MRISIRRLIFASLAGYLSVVGSAGAQPGVAGASGPPTSGSQWSVMRLAYREDFAVAQVGTQVLIAGGRNPTSDLVDIYDASTGAWSTAQLSQARSAMATATIGTWVLFAGGYTPAGPSDVVDLYDSASGQWSATRLSSARAPLGVAVLGTQALFAGGRDKGHDSDVVDVYDSVTGSWSAGRLSEAHARVLVAAVGTQALIAGDRTGEVVDIYDAATGQWAHEHTGARVHPYRGREPGRLPQSGRP